MMNQVACMSDLWLFSQLSPAEKSHLQSVARRRSYAKGETLFAEGDPSSSVFLITAGRAKLFKLSEEGKEIVLGFLTPHDLCGEESLFAESVHSMSAEAVEPTRICACDKSDFERLIAANPDVAVKVIRAMGEKLNQVTEQLVGFAMENVRERVAHVLARLAREHGRETERGLCLSFRLTHEDLGTLVGASRVMVTNVLQDLRRAGYVSTDDQRHFVINAQLVAQASAPKTESPITRPSCPCFREACPTS